MTRYTPLWIQQGNYPASLDRQLIGELFPYGGVDGCAVTTASAMTLNVASGRVAVPVQGSSSVLCVSDATEQVTLSAAPASGTNRIDLVIAQVRANDIDGGANNDFIFSTVTGAAAASPSVPATPTNAVAIAQVYVPGAAASIVQGNITDVRLPMKPWGVAWGRVAAPAEITANTTLTTTLADIANLAVAFTAIPNRLYRATLGASQVQIGANGNLANIFLANAANAQLMGQSVGGGAVTVFNLGFGPLRTRDLSGLTGAQTIKARGSTTTANATIAANANQPVILTVEDVGPSN